ncbi:unnamed protein product, partial [Chrysoparadoxa australica]
MEFASEEGVLVTDGGLSVTTTANALPAVSASATGSGYSGALVELDVHDGLGDAFSFVKGRSGTHVVVEVSSSGKITADGGLQTGGNGIVDAGGGITAGGRTVFRMASIPASD